jgi:Spy/CpxP family protein refolding chaperone
MKKLFKGMLIALVIAAFAIPGFSIDDSKHTCKKTCEHQHGKEGKCCKAVDLKLTEKQQAEMDKLHKECMESTKKIHEKIAELQEKKCKLMAAEKPDKKAIDKIIEEIGKLTVQGKKIIAGCQLETRAVLTPEQLKKCKEMMGKKCCHQGPCCRHGDHKHGKKAHHKHKEHK